MRLIGGLPLQWYRGRSSPTRPSEKCARVQLIKNGKKIAAFVPNDGCLNFIEENVRWPLLAHA